MANSPQSTRRRYLLGRLVGQVVPFAYGVRLWRQGLRATGWTRSIRERSSVDRLGRPLPWVTYPAIALLEARVTPDLRVYEWGAGNSTLWWAARVSEIVSVEHNADWLDQLTDQVPNNVTLLHRDVRSDDYSTVKNGPFDIVVVDGRHRVACATKAIDVLSKKGVIVWDNSERSRYRPGIDALLEAGMRRLPLEGFGPVATVPWETTIFYRDGNCLGL